MNCDRYTRHVTIADNEFSWIGCSPMASWGYTNEDDGLDGQQPRYTSVLRNYVREWGHYEKQSSMWSNNKACLARIEANVVFNGRTYYFPGQELLASARMLRVCSLDLVAAVCSPRRDQLCTLIVIVPAPVHSRRASEMCLTR
jgi:hypothetical protein